MTTEPPSNAPEEGSDLIAELKKAVQESGLSQSQIARESGLSQAQLSRFIAGSRTLSLESAAKLFIYFGLRVVKSGDRPTPQHELPQESPGSKKKSKGKK